MSEDLLDMARNLAQSLERQPTTAELILKLVVAIERLRTELFDAQQAILREGSDAEQCAELK